MYEQIRNTVPGKWYWPLSSTNLEHKRYTPIIDFYDMIALLRLYFLEIPIQIRTTQINFYNL